MMTRNMSSLPYSISKVLNTAAFLAVCIFNVGNARIFYDALLAGRLLAPAFTPSVLYTAYAAPAAVATSPPQPELAPRKLSPPISPASAPPSWLSLALSPSILSPAAPVPTAQPAPSVPSIQIPSLSPAQRLPSIQSPALSLPPPAAAPIQIAAISPAFGLTLNEQPTLSASPIQTTVPIEQMHASCTPSSICHYPLPGISEPPPPPDYHLSTETRLVEQPPLRLVQVIPGSDASQIIKPRPQILDAEGIRHPFEELPYNPTASNVPIYPKVEPNAQSTLPVKGQPTDVSHFPLCPSGSYISLPSQPPSFSPPEATAVLPSGSILAENSVAVTPTLLAYAPCASSVLFADPVPLLSTPPALEFLAHQPSTPVAAHALPATVPVPTVAVPSLPSAAFLPPLSSLAQAIPLEERVPVLPGAPALVPAAPVATQQLLAPTFAAAPTVVPPPGLAAYAPPTPSATISYAPPVPTFVAAPYPASYASHKQHVREKPLRDSNFKNNILHNDVNAKKSNENDEQLVGVPSAPPTVNKIYAPIIRRGRLAQRQNERRKATESKRQD